MATQVVPKRLSRQPPLNQMRLGYFLYFLGLGVFLPYFSPFLVAQGFSPTEVGLLLAVVMGAKIIGPPLLGWLVDHTARVMPWLRLMGLLAVLSFALVPLLLWRAPPATDGLVWWIAALALFGLAWQSLLPQLDVLALRMLGGQRNRYTALRAWGSIGFIVAAVLLGGLYTASRAVLVPVGLLTALILLAVLLLRLPEPAQPVTHPHPHHRFGRQLWRWPVVGFLLSHFLINLAHGVYYAFFSIHLAEHGYHGLVIGLLWGLGVVAEIVLFFLLPRVMHWFRAGPLLLVAILLMMLRWLMIGWLVDDLLWLLLAQMLHAASFGLTHAIGIHVINYRFPGRLQARGQAILSGFSYGGGAAAGLYLAGLLWTGLGAQGAFAAMAGVSLLSALILLPIIRSVVWSPGDPATAVSNPLPSEIRG